jgi:spore maturation protein CgeB
VSGRRALDIVVLGLSITSSWGNGHATTYRALLRALAGRGHRVLFLERDVPWYAAHRDLPQPPYGRTALYASLAELRERWAAAVRSAELVVVGSYVPEGSAVGEWALAVATGPVVFYDIDTPVTIATLHAGECEYLSRALLPRYDAYLSFTGGRLLERVASELGARCVAPLYCSVDPVLYAPIDAEPEWDLGYMGTYSADRQPPLEALLLAAARAWPAGRFVVAGPQYPMGIAWPTNVARIEHVAPARHVAFYGAQRFTLNVTRRAMVDAGHSPSVRLFEAAACAVPVISDAWPGLEEFFRPGDEILIAHDARDTLAYLRELPESERRELGQRARARVLAAHTAAHRAAELEAYAHALIAGRVLTTP